MFSSGNPRVPLRESRVAGRLLIVARAVGRAKRGLSMMSIPNAEQSSSMPSSQISARPLLKRLSISSPQTRSTNASFSSGTNCGSLTLSLWFVLHVEHVFMYTTLRESAGKRYGVLRESPQYAQIDVKCVKNIGLPNYRNKTWNSRVKH